MITEHNDLTDRDAINGHPISAITDLSTTLNNKAENIDDLSDAKSDTTSIFL